MIKKIIVIVMIIASSQSITAQILFNANGINQIVYDSIVDGDILLGNCDVEGIKHSRVFESSFDEEQNYTPNMGMFMPGDNSLNDMDITIILGSWCSDSQREVPRMIKVLEALDYPMSMLRIIAVDRKKEVSNMNISDFDVKYVPTFIFYKNNEEVGRIVEMPKQSLEVDIVNILNR